MEGRVSILLGCIRASRTVSFCFSFSHVARYATSCTTKTSDTIGKNPSQANLLNLPKEVVYKCLIFSSDLLLPLVIMKM